MMTRAITTKDLSSPHSAMSMARDVAPFDLWLDAELKQHHGAVLREPVPDVLKALVEQFR